MVELPVGMHEDRVLGGFVRIQAAIGAGRRRFEPGLFAHANRGILYVDEVNLLGDLVDIILDAAAMGRNYVEREGVVAHPARFLLVGTMNPEEGELRPRCSTGLRWSRPRLHEPGPRAEAVRRRMAFEADPAGFAARWAAREAEERRRVARARALLPAVTVSEPMLELIVHVCASFEVDGLRADLAIYPRCRCPRRVRSPQRGNGRRRARRRRTGAAHRRRAPLRTAGHGPGAPGRGH
ncbi:MAG: ATP-binding protein [Dehalococcoidia bacterium]